MIIELRSLLPALPEEENGNPRKPERKPEPGAAPVVEVELRSDGAPRTPEGAPFSASLPERALLPEEASAHGPGSTGDASRDDRVPELLERLLGAAERSAVSSEQIAGLMERQNSVSAPVYA